MNEDSNDGRASTGKRGFGLIDHQATVELRNQKPPSSALNYAYLPEITRQILFDSSESESEHTDAMTTERGIKSVHYGFPINSGPSRLSVDPSSSCSKSSVVNVASEVDETVNIGCPRKRQRTSCMNTLNSIALGDGIFDNLMHENSSFSNAFPCTVPLSSLNRETNSGGTSLRSNLSLQQGQSLPDDDVDRFVPREYEINPQTSNPSSLSAKVHIITPNSKVLDQLNRQQEMLNSASSSPPERTPRRCNQENTKRPDGKGKNQSLSSSEQSFFQRHRNQVALESDPKTLDNMNGSTMLGNVSVVNAPQSRNTPSSSRPLRGPLIPEHSTSAAGFSLLTREVTSGPTSRSFVSGPSDSSYLKSVVGSARNDFSRPNNVLSNQSSTNSNVDKRISDSSSLRCQETSGTSDSGIVIMSLLYKKNKLAGSSYNSSTGVVYLLESVSENFEFCNTILALRSVTPSIVILPSSGASRFVKELKANIEGDRTLGDCQFQCISPRYFAYSFARQTVLESSLWEGCLTFHSDDAKKNAILSTINLNDERLVCAFGGLLYHISTSCPRLGDRLSPTPITSVQPIKLSHKLWLDTESFQNLQIFDPAEHPSSFKWSSNRDDGRSIFGLFERFCSPVGLSKLKLFLANPVTCRRVITTRHEVIDFYLNVSNYNAVVALKNFASQMSSSSVVMNYLSQPTLRGAHWKHIYRHIYYTVSYAEVCRSHGNQSELFRELGGSIVDAVYSMAHNLERTIDLVNMENNESFVVKYGFHPPLDAAKEKFSRLKIAMDKVTPYEFDSVPPFITKIQMMYIPEMKFLLSIPHWAPDLKKEDLNLPNLEFRFTANKTAFYKSRRCYELDELLGDAQTDIINEESMIIQSLRNYLKRHMHHIVGMSQKIAEIECIFALARVALEERYTKPEIMNSCVIDVRGGWHPLLDVPANEMISNDFISSANTSLVKLIYGPNASGKSIYLKQVGLILYLVHVGSFVPAISAKVGLFSRILARTAVEESIISMSSTLLSELKKLQDAVMGGVKDSLVILDEVGKGSTEINGISIVTSAVNYFLSRGEDCPHVVFSTHVTGIRDFVENTSLFELQVMDYTIADGEIVFLYKIRRGSPDGSFVFEVLEKTEFAAPVVKTARTVLEALRTGENFLPYCKTRIQRSHKYLNFIRKFVNIDMSKPGYLEKLQNKIQRYYEKPSY